MRDTPPDRVRLGAFEVDLRAGELRQGEQRVFLREQPWFILRMLVERDGELVTRDEIKQKLWPNDTVVDFDQGINAAIRGLRQALGDSADEPAYLGTVARRGYRLLVPVEAILLERAASSVPSLEKPKDEQTLSVDTSGGYLVGKKVSHYRILDLLGGGGMGVVYKAEDLKLGRRVAIKFLPVELANDPRAFHRLEQEARAASALDHRHICSIYELGEHEGQPFIVMQLLEGQTLQEKLEAATQEQRTLPLSEVLDVAVQITEGLEAAHQKGIIHRDIKPANIFITSRDEAKILDFGLAKGLENEFTDKNHLERDADKELAVGVTPQSAFSVRLTLTGIQMGTAFYMSPEQVRGEKLDARTDIFSFGLMLYLMVSGKRAFPGDTIQVVHDGILHNSPAPLQQLNPALPAKLIAIIDKCLEKHRERRYQSAAEIIADLQVLQRHNSTRPRRSRWMLVGIVAVILCSTLFFVFRVKPPKPELTKDPTVRPLIPASADHPLMGWVALSPDGKHLAYGDRVSGILILQVDTGETRSFPNTTAFCPISWLRDGEHLLLSKVAESGTWKMSTVDGTTRKLHDGNVHLFPSPVSQQFAFLDGHDLNTEDPGQSPRKLVSFGANWTPIYIIWSPTGHRIAYDKSQIVQPDVSKLKIEANLGTCDWAGHCSTVLSNPRLATGSDITNLAWLPDGRIVFALRELPPNDESANLWSLDVDPATGKTSGQPKRLTNWSGVEPKSLSASADGMRLALLQFQTERRIKIAELRAGGTALGKTRPLNSDTWHAVPSGWTHDSKTVLFNGYRHGQKGIFKQSIDNANAEVLASSAGGDVHPVLSPDGLWLFYTEYPEGAPPRLMRSALAGEPSTILLPGDYGYGCAATPGGLCILSELKGDRLVFSRLDPLKGRGEELLSTPLKHSSQGGLAYAWSLSSDGKRIALVDAGSEDQIRILEVEGGVRVITLKDWRRLSAVSWTADGRHLYISGSRDLAVEQSTFAILETDLSGTFKVLTQVPADQGWLGHPVPSPDGRYLAYTEWKYTSGVVMLEKF